MHHILTTYIYQKFFDKIQDTNQIDTLIALHVFSHDNLKMYFIY